MKWGRCPWNFSLSCCAVLQEGEVTPVGSCTPIPVDVQVIAATNRNLENEVAEGSFREDLYFRLNMVELHVPALRKRPQDIPHFIDFFSRKFAERYNRDPWQPNGDELAAFCEYGWPGNIRQLSHAIEQAYVLDCVPTLPTSRNAVVRDSELPYFNLEKLRSTAVRQALQATQGHKGRAARLLGVHANTLTRLLAQLDDNSKG